ncbi:MAG: hypothetical protein ACOCP4_06250 [Candidatus Woesearchaeota archaeon]
MLNLSKLARDSPEYPIFRKIRSIRDPDIYLARSLADYKENTCSLDFPWYKRFPFTDNFMDRAYIIFQNIGLKKLSYEEVENPNWFLIHDKTGQEITYWNSDHDLFPTLTSFDELQSEQGLKEDYWVQDVFARYLISSNLLSIIEVNRNNFSNRKLEEESLVDKIKDLFPNSEPELRPAF